MSDQSETCVLSGNYATGSVPLNYETEPMSDQNSGFFSVEDFGEDAGSLAKFFAIHAQLVKEGKVEMKPAEMCRETDARNIQTLRSAESFALSKIVGRSNSR